MSIVRIHADTLVGIYQSGRALQVSADMSLEQRKAAIVALLGGMPEQEAFEFLRSKFPTWFASEAA